MLAGQKVLIADDDISFCNLLGRLLSLEGYSVLKAFDIKSAVKILQQEEVGLVLLDMNLPDGNGTQFTKVIKEDYPAVHVIILTAHADISSCVRSIKNGADDYVIKGDDTSKLLELLKEQFAEKTAAANKGVAVTKTTIEKNSNLLHGFANIIGNSAAIKTGLAIVKLCHKIMHSIISAHILHIPHTGKPHGFYGNVSGKFNCFFQINMHRHIRIHAGKKRLIALLNLNGSIVNRNEPYHNRNRQSCERLIYLLKSKRFCECSCWSRRRRQIYFDIRFLNCDILDNGVFEQ